MLDGDSRRIRRHAPMKMPPQIVRLVFLTVFIIGSYLVARALLTPASFGQYGFFRGDALEEIAARKPVYAGKVSCDECHSDRVQLLAKGAHQTISCESCHGAAKAHADDPEIKTHKLTDLECLRCHESDPARPAFVKQITIKDHFRGERCIGCHVPHHPTEVP
jgi:hypothetical protein